MCIDPKHIIFCTQFSAQNAGNRILGHWNVEIFKGCMPPVPSRRREVKASFWYSRLLFSNLLATSIFIETPACWFLSFLNIANADIHKKGNGP